MVPMEPTPEGTRGERRRAGGIMKFLGRLSAALYRRGIGRRMGAMPLLLLTTMGARTGRRHTTAVAWFPDGDSWVIAATFAGSASHPAWYRNLLTHPDQVWIEVGDRRVHVRPEQLRDAERDAWWARIRDSGANFAGYEAKTDRVFPIMRLTEIS